MSVRGQIERAPDAELMIEIGRVLPRRDGAPTLLAHVLGDGDEVTHVFGELRFGHAVDLVSPEQRRVAGRHRSRPVDAPSYGDDLCLVSERSVNAGASVASVAPACALVACRPSAVFLAAEHVPAAGKRPRADVLTASRVVHAAQRSTERRHDRRSSTHEHIQ
jgi:hypothetical protein